MADVTPPKQPCQRGGCAHHGDSHPRCTAHNRAGKACGGLPVDGTNVCRMHGGTTPNAQRVVKERRQEAEIREMARTLGVPIDVDPKDAILQEIAWCAGHVAWYRSRVQALDPDALIRGPRSEQLTVRTGFQAGEQTTTDSGNDVNLFLRLYNEERDRYQRLCLQAIKVGIEERRIRLEESKADLLVQGLEWMIGEARTRLDLSEAAVAALTDVVAEAMQRIDVGAPATP
jgi:hypothetical protein